jgi:hypothetical protein
MGLNFAKFASIQSGGGNSWNRVIPFTGTQPKKGDFLVVQVLSQFGLTTPTPSPINVTWQDDAGNLWQHLTQRYYSRNSTLNYAGQFAIDVFFCPFHNGNPLGNFLTSCAAIADAYDFQCFYSYSDWQLNFKGLDVVQSTLIVVSTDTPTLAAFQLGIDQLTINSFWAPAPPGVGIDPITSTPEYSTLNDGNAGNYYDEYVARAVNRNQAPSITAGGGANDIWLGTSLVFNISPPSVLFNQVFMSRKVLAIEE